VTTAKVVSLTVLPYQVSQLCFSVSGILQKLNAQLGQTVSAFDLTGAYSTIGGDLLINTQGGLGPTMPGDPSRLLYDAAAIDPVAISSLATLRAEPIKAALTKAINARQNAYYAKYGNIATIAAEAKKYYSQSPSVPDSKPNRLQTLSQLAHQQNTQLQNAYQHDQIDGVVKHTKSQLTSQTTTSGTDKSWGQSDDTEEDGMVRGQEEGSGLNASTPVSVAAGTAPPPLSLSTKGLPKYTFPLTDVGYATADADFGVTTEVSQSTGSATESQTIVNTDYGYRMPSIESQAQNERAQISLIDEKWNTLLAFQNVDQLDVVLPNQLQSMDLDVYRLQVAYLDTMLFSAIAGIVTGVYKNPGDPVRAGEPVVRVESVDAILIAGSVIYPGPITVGTAVTINTNMFDAGGPISIPGVVVAVRGYRQDNEWQIVVSQTTESDGLGNTFGLPLGYRFDYDDTTIEIA
jgi:hypothetical protein